MARYRTVVSITTLAGTLAGCSGSRSGQAAQGAPDSLRSLTFKEITEHVTRLDSSASRCPVTMRFEGVVSVSHMAGKLRYRWERNIGARGDTLESDIPSAARKGTADIAVTPDDWTDSERGVMLFLTDRLHILAPIDKMSPPVDVQVRCN